MDEEVELADLGEQLVELFRVTQAIQASRMESEDGEVLIFQPPYTLQPEVQYIFRMVDGSQQIWIVEPYRDGLRYLSEAPRESIQ